jgi:hypothetical protein
MAGSLVYPSNDKKVTTKSAKLGLKIIGRNLTNKNIKHIKVSETAFITVLTSKHKRLSTAGIHNSYPRVS